MNLMLLQSLIALIINWEIARCWFSTLEEVNFDIKLYRHFPNLGTLDVSILRMIDNDVDVKAVAGDIHLGMYYSFKQE